ncbi:recombinase family protein, partial [Nakamurella silvestris]
CRPGDTLVVTKLDRLARSIRDASAIADELQAKKVKLSLGGSVHDPADPLGRMVFSMMAVFAEFEADLARMRTREGMQAAKAKGRLRGRQPKLKPSTEKTLVQMWHAGSHTQKELADIFGVSRTTVIRAVARAGGH